MQFSQILSYLQGKEARLSSYNLTHEVLVPLSPRSSVFSPLLLSIYPSFLQADYRETRSLVQRFGSASIHMILTFYG